MSRLFASLLAVLLAGSILAQTVGKPAPKPAPKPNGQAAGKTVNGQPVKPIPPPPPPKVSPEAVRDFVRLRAERRFDALLQTARAMTVAAPTDPVGWGYLGEAQMRVGDWQQAAQALRMALGLKSKSPADPVNLATVLVQVGINRLRLGYVASDVELLWRETQTLNPENPWPYVCMGDLALRQGDARQAEREYLRAVRVDATCFAAYSGLTRVYELLGQADLARTCREASEALAPPIRPAAAALSASPVPAVPPATAALRPAAP